MKVVDSVGALAGLAGVALMGAMVTLAAPSTGAEPAFVDDSAAKVAAALSANAASPRTAAWCGVAAIFFMVVFFGRLHGALSALGGPNLWLRSVVVTAGPVFTAVLIVDTGFTFAGSETAGYKFDPQVAKTILV